MTGSDQPRSQDQLRNQAPDVKRAPDVERATDVEQAPDVEQARAVSRKEHALWLLERLVPGTGINNLGIALHLDGRLKDAALAEALAVVLRRYEALRTVFAPVGGELAKDLLPPERFHVPVGDLDLPAGPLPDSRLEAELRRFIDRPFPLDGTPLVRVGLAHRPDGDIFCMSVHHLVFDMTSAAILVRTLVPVYEAVAAGGPVPAEALTEVPLTPEPQPSETDLAYWRESLAGLAPDGLDLWCGTPRANRPRLSGDTATHTLSEAARTAVRQLQRQVRAPVAAVLLAAYHLLLASHGAGPDLVVGTPLDIRGQHPGHEIGYHVNVLPLRMRVDFGEGFRTLAREARDRFLAAMAHGGVSVDDLSAELPRSGASWQTNLYRHVFNYLPQIDSEALTVDGMRARLVSVGHDYSKFDLELIALPSKAEISFRYNSQVLDRPDVEALLLRYDALLIDAAADVDRPVGAYAGWSDADRRVVQGAGPAEDRAAPPSGPRTLVDAVHAWARRTPRAPAIVDGAEVVGYGRLWEAADAIRAALAESGVRAGDVVPVTATRPGDLAAAALGIWRAGAVCLPVGPVPAAGVGRLLEASGARLVLALPGATAADGTTLPVLRPPGAVPPADDSGTPSAPTATVPVGSAGPDEPVGSVEPAALVGPAESAEPVQPTKLAGPAAPAGSAAPAAPAGTAESAVLAGSAEQTELTGPAEPAEPAELAGSAGSAGSAEPAVSVDAAWLVVDPGAVEPVVPAALGHRDLMAMTDHFAGELDAAPGTATLAWAGPVSLGTPLELFLPLATGGRIVTVPAASGTGGPEAASPSDLADLIGRHDVRILPVPAGTLPPIPCGDGDRLEGLRIVAQGESLPPALARRLVAAGARLHSVHGVPETGWALSGEVGKDGSGLTGGRPVAGVRARVVAPDGRELPVGVRGELRLARRSGTGGAPTGVLARWRPDGTVERLGPVGESTAVAGKPYHLGIVDAALRDHPGVAAAATVALETPGRDAVLVGFVVPADDGDAPGDLARAARDHARDHLPEAAVPAYVSCLEALPWRPDGRFDRDALLRLAADPAAGDTGRAADAAGGPGADGGLVEDLVALWQRLLKVEVTAETGFFAAGGHSLLAARLAQDVEELTGVGVALAEIFEHPTPAALAARLAETQAG